VWCSAEHLDMTGSDRRADTLCDSEIGEVKCGCSAEHLDMTRSDRRADTLCDSEIGEVKCVV
jgi:hypothetical protein